MIRNKLVSQNSPLSRLDPRISLIYTVLFSIVIAVSNKIPVVASGLLSSFIFLLFSRLKLISVIYRLIFINIFILFLWFILPFSIPGETIFSLWKFNASKEGIMYSLLITIKCNAIVLTSIALLTTQGIFRLVHAMSHLHIPDKIIYLFFLLYRYIGVIWDEYSGIKRALRIRGFRSSTSLQSYKTYAYVMGTLFVRSYNRAENVHKAMLCRGFNGKYWLLNHFKLNYKDLIAGIGMLFNILILILFQWITIVF